MDIMVAGSMDSIVMVEGEMSEVSEDEMVDAIEAAHAAIQKQCEAQIDMAAEVQATTPKREYSMKARRQPEAGHQRRLLPRSTTMPPRTPAPRRSVAPRSRPLKEAFLASMSDEDKGSEKVFMLRDYFKATQKKAIRDLLLNEGIRLDGRGTKDIRPIWCEVDYLPGPHGSSVFTRGETQSLTTLTLGTKDSTSS